MGKKKLVFIVKIGQNCSIWPKFTSFEVKKWPLSSVQVPLKTATFLSSWSGVLPEPGPSSAGLRSCRACDGACTVRGCPCTAPECACWCEDEARKRQSRAPSCRWVWSQTYDRWKICSGSPTRGNRFSESICNTIH